MIRSDEASMTRCNRLGPIGVAVALLLLVSGASNAQEAASPIVGFLNTGSPGPFGHLAAAFRRGLAEAGFSDGRNVTIEYRWGEGRYEQLPAMAAELRDRRVAVLVATGGDPAIRAARAASSTIPIVFATGSDPVALGYVASLNRPGGNVTGVTQLTNTLEAKRIGLLRELVPRADKIGVLTNPTFPTTPMQLRDVDAAATTLGVQVALAEASSESELEPAFVALTDQKIAALMVGSDPFFNTRRQRLVALAAQHRVPAIYEFREFTAAGGLMSYGTSLADAYQQVGNYTARILRGARPDELPVVQSSRFEFVVNLKAARALGLEVPPTLAARADEIME